MYPYMVVKIEYHGGGVEAPVYVVRDARDGAIVTGYYRRQTLAALIARVLYHQEFKRSPSETAEDRSGHDNVPTST